MLDQPWLTNRPPWEHSWLEDNAEAVSLTAGQNADETRQLARAIKDIARAGGNVVTPEILKSAERSALSRYVVGRLLRNPFADATQMIREFPKRDGN